MKFIKLTISIKNDYHETLIAELSEMDFDAFQQLDNALVTYIPKEQFYVGDRERIEQLLAGLPGNAYVQAEEVVANQNWNEEWEKTIQAQQVGRFLVKPTWSAATANEDQILLEIDPKMAFGTGYHETTRLMLRWLPEAISGGQRVLDAGTGTGILSIAAIKLGARHVLAFDVDEWSIMNSRENIYLNGVTEEKISIRKGSVEVVKQDEQFDVIAANIERNTIVNMLPALAAHLKPGGNILLSGLLKKDQPDIEESLNNCGLNYKKTSREDEWIAVWADKIKQ